MEERVDRTEEEIYEEGHGHTKAMAECLARELTTKYPEKPIDFVKAELLVLDSEELPFCYMAEEPWMPGRFLKMTPGYISEDSELAQAAGGGKAKLSAKDSRAAFATRCKDTPLSRFFAAAAATAATASPLLALLFGAEVKDSFAGATFAWQRGGRASRVSRPDLQPTKQALKKGRSSSPSMVRT